LKDIGDKAKKAADEAKDKSGLYGKEPAGKPIDSSGHKEFKMKDLTPGGSPNPKFAGKGVGSDEVLKYKGGDYPVMKLITENPFKKIVADAALS